VPADAPSHQAFVHYRRAAVRDLAWLVFDGALQLPHGSGAPATVVLDAAERAELLALLHQWDDDAEDGWLGPVDPNLRLGLYTERLLGAWLAHAGTIRLLAQNWPLRSSRITIGEADFLVQRRSSNAENPRGARQGGLQLWELACKFYLGVPGRGWIGPGLNDSLAAKLARMRSHQLQLIHQPGFSAAWQGDWSALAWLAGWLLAPVADQAAAPAGRIPGVWAEAAGASLACAQARAAALEVEQWWLLPKRRWLRPMHGDAPVAQAFEGLRDAAAFIAGPSAPRQRGTGFARPLMLAGMRGPDRSGIATEVLRLMLVPQGWSQRAAALPDARQRTTS